MGENSKIEWTDHTFNPWIGCTKVAAGCKNCYAENLMDSRYKKVQWGPNGTRVLTSPENWRKPIAWNKAARAEGIRRRVFCASLADVFEDWPGPILDHNGCGMFVCNSCGEWIDGAKPEVQAFAPACSKCVLNGGRWLALDDVRRKLFALIDATPWLDWLLLTKRPENIGRMLWGSIPKLKTALKHPAGTPEANLWHHPNVWLGTSVSTQADADRNIGHLLKCRDLSPVLFVSAEPLLGPVDLNADRGWLVPWDDSDGVCGPETWNGLFVCGNGHSAARYLKSEAAGQNLCLVSGCGASVYPAKPGIDWVIVGGESGPRARPMHPDWARSLRDQCKAAGVPFLFKQWGEFQPRIVNPPVVGENGLEFPDKEIVTRVGKKATGRELDGRTWDEFPQVASVCK